MARRVGAYAVMVAAALTLLTGLVRAQAPAAGATGAPAALEVRFQDQVDAMLAQDRVAPPPSGGILFIGSSIFRQWANLEAHMRPLPAFNRAFGGARTWEVLHYMDRLVLPHRPKFIVYYCGSNDVNAGQEAAAIAGRIETFVSRVHAALPQTHVFFASVHKAPQKRAQWHVVDGVNAAVRRMAATTPHLSYIEMNPLLFDGQGEPRLSIYQPDGLHFLPPAYDEFAALIKPILEQAWRKAP